MATTTLYPNDQTFLRVVSAIGNTNILWVLNNQISVLYTVGAAKVLVQDSASSGAATFNGLVIMGGNTGLAAAVDGTFGFSWNPKQSGQDDAAQTAVLKLVRLPLPILLT